MKLSTRDEKLKTRVNRFVPKLLIALRSAFNQVHYLSLGSFVTQTSDRSSVSQVLVYCGFGITLLLYPWFPESLIEL